MNTDQIFEEIQNNYLYIQEEYQELDNLIYKYNNLNYAFEEVSVQLEAINKFGLSDETNYFINKDNYLVENNYIAEEDLYDKNKVIVTLEGILSTIINGIKKIIESIIKIVKNIFKFIFGIIKKIFNISNNTDKKTKNIKVSLNDLKKDLEKDLKNKTKDDNEKEINKTVNKYNEEEKIINEIYNKIKDHDFSVNNWLYNKFKSINNDSSSYNSLSIGDILFNCLDVLIENFNLFCYDAGDNFSRYKNIFLSDLQENNVGKIIYQFYSPFKNYFEPFNKQSNLDDIKNVVNSFKLLMIHGKDTPYNRYCISTVSEFNMLIDNSINPNNLPSIGSSKKYIFNSFVTTSLFKKNISEIVLFKNKINLIKDKIIDINKSLKHKVIIDNMITFFDFIEATNNWYKIYTKNISDDLDKVSRNFNKLLLAINKLLAGMDNVKKDDKVSTEEFIKTAKYCNDFFSILIGNLNTNNKCIVNDFGNSYIRILGSMIKSFDNIVNFTDKMLSDIKKHK